MKKKSFLAVLVGLSLLLTCASGLVPALAALDLSLRELGDVNGDGVVDIDDILAIRGQMFGQIELPDDDLLMADVTDDGIIDIDDILQVRAIMFGTISPTRRPFATPGTTLTPDTTPSAEVTAAPTATKAPAVPTLRPTEVPADGQRQYDRYALSRYPTQKMTDAGLAEAWPLVVDAILMHKSPLLAADFGITQAEVGVLLEQFESYHFFRGFISDATKAGDYGWRMYYYYETQEHFQRVNEAILFVNALLKHLAPPGANELDRIFSCYLYVTSTNIEYTPINEIWGNQNAYVGLMERKASCCGFGETCSFLMQQCGIEAYRCNGYNVPWNGTSTKADTSDDAHGFMQLEFEGDLYNCDPSNGRRFSKDIFGDVFALLMTNADMQSTPGKQMNNSGLYRVGFPPWDTYTPPVCNSTKFAALHKQEHALNTSADKNLYTIKQDIAGHTVTFPQKVSGTVVRMVYDTVSRTVTQEP